MCLLCDVEFIKWSKWGNVKEIYENDHLNVLKLSQTIGSKHVISQLRKECCRHSCLVTWGPRRLSDSKLMTLSVPLGAGFVCLWLLKVPLHPNHVFFVFNVFLELINGNHGVFFHSTLLRSILKILILCISLYRLHLVEWRCYWHCLVSQ